LKRFTKTVLGGLTLTLTLGLTLVGAGSSGAAVDLFQSPAGGNTDRFFGWSVSPAGDVNGDGFADFVVGAPFDAAKGAEAGRAFIWFGGPFMSDVPNVILDDGSAEDWFGFSVAGIGDIDDDGFDDVAVGAPGDDRNGLAKSGSVYVYLGRSEGQDETQLNWNVEQVVAGEVAGDRFGWSVSGAGDMDRDGIDDFVVGAPYNDATGTDRGRAYLFTGDRGDVATTPAVIWDGPAVAGPQSTTRFANFAPDGTSIQGPGFGWVVADLGNFRGLNRAAIAIGAPGAAGAIGEVRLFVASAIAGTLPSTTPETVFGNSGQAGDAFGWSVASGGMIDGDARNDLLVGVPGDENGRGQVKIFYGSSDPPATDDVASVVYQGQTTGDQFGYAVAGAGDHLGSPGTWLVGAPTRDDAGLDGGWVYVYDRTAQLPTNLLPRNRSGSAEAGDRWGFALCGLGDLDLDGSDEFLVGAPQANDATSTRGLVGLISSDAGVVSVDTPEDEGLPLDDARLALRAESIDSGDVEMRFSTGSDGPWSLRVFDVRGRVVTTLASGMGAVTERVVRFDGRDERGKLVARGRYFVALDQNGRRRADGFVHLR